MRFSTAIFAGLVAFATAQDAATTTAASQSAEQSTVTSCLNTCDPTDVDCRAQCVGVPNPSDEMVSANNACVEECPKGTGSEADIAVYSNCVTDCIASFFYTATGELSGGATSTAGSQSETTGTSSFDGSSDGSSDSGSESESGSSSSSTDESNPDSGSGSGIVSISAAAFGLSAFLTVFATL